MSSKKVPLVRTVKLTPDETGIGSNRRHVVYAQVRPAGYRKTGRGLPGAVGAALRERTATGHGRLVFLDKRPKRAFRHLLVVGVPNGVVLVYYKGAWGSPAVEYLPMCSGYRNALAGSVGKVRWARVRVSKAVSA